MVYYTRSYKKLFLIIADFFPILKLMLFILKKCTQHIKISFSKRNLASLLFDNVKIKQKKVRFSRQIERPSYSSLNHFESKIKFETNNNNSKKELKNNNNEEILYFNRSNNLNNIIELKINKISKQKNSSFFEQNNSILAKKNSDSMIKSNISNNKSNISLNNENLIQILNKQGITNINLNKISKSFFPFNDSKMKDSYKTHIQKKINNKKESIYFRIFIFFLMFFLINLKSRQNFVAFQRNIF